jgi:hypothetical protein
MTNTNRAISFAASFVLLFCFAASPSYAKTTSVPRIVSFSASPAKVGRGAPVVLAWNAENTSGCQLRYDHEEKGGAVGSRYLYSNTGGVGSFTVNPQYTTTYEIYCTKGTSVSEGITSASKKLTVSVSREAKAPSIVLGKVTAKGLTTTVSVKYKNIPKKAGAFMVLKKNWTGEVITQYGLAKGGNGSMKLKLRSDGSRKSGFGYVLEVQGISKPWPVTEEFFVPGDIVK